MSLARFTRVGYVSGLARFRDVGVGDGLARMDSMDVVLGLGSRRSRGCRYGVGYCFGNRQYAEPISLTTVQNISFLYRCSGSSSAYGRRAG